MAPSAPSPALQVVIAVVLLFLVYALVLWLIGKPAVVANPLDQRRVRPKESTTIVKGYAPSARLANLAFNSNNAFDRENFRKMPRSVNTMGGAQFSYGFWIKLETTDDNAFKDRILLLKGDARRFKTATYDPETNRRLDQKPADYVVACPMISFGDSYRHFRIMLNTTAHPQTRIDVRTHAGADAGLSRRNVLSLLPLKWHLLTFTFEDGVSPSTGHENGVRVRVWLDDFMIQESSATTHSLLHNSALRQNDGHLFVLPDAPADKLLQMGDVTYYNWALDASDVANAFRRGAPKQAMEVSPDAGKQAPPYLSAFNKIDIYNR